MNIFDFGAAAGFPACGRVGRRSAVVVGVDGGLEGASIRVVSQQTEMEFQQ
ncbi:MAG TPA: hypothetical protein VLI06_03940 [Solimonas sp.]|nr:hypothetical protein [Solimonas sp.]